MCLFIWFCCLSRVFEDYNALVKGGLEIAKAIASKSPIAVQGSKINLNFSRDHSVEDGLRFIVSAYLYFKAMFFS